VVDGNTYEDDSSQIGTSMFSVSDDKKWAYSSTGDFVGNENADYIARNTSKLNLPYPELYTEARLSPLSLKYTVKLHFAEIVFTEDHTYSSNGKRVFDVFIQVMCLPIVVPNLSHSVWHLSFHSTTTSLVCHTCLWSIKSCKYKQFVKDR